MSGLVVDLFAGPGGADEGIRAAGWAGELVGLELDDDACDTAEAAGHHRLREDVTAFDRTPFHGLDGLWASPPCQTFSRSGKRAGLDDARGALVWQPLEWARELRPRWVALEQVEDVLPLWRVTADALRADGYSAWTGVVNAADYGVPQVRRRAVLVARRDGLPALPPVPTHGERPDGDLFGQALEPWITMADALGWSHDVAYRRTRGAGIAARHGDRPDTPVSRPAPTITGKSRSDTWVLERPATTACGDPRTGRPGHKDRAGGERQFGDGSVKVSVEEAAVLQGFRRDYPWSGSRSSAHQQAGNAVPPPLAAAMVAPLLSRVPEWVA